MHLTTNVCSYEVNPFIHGCRCSGGGEHSSLIESPMMMHPPMMGFKRASNGAIETDSFQSDRQAVYNMLQQHHDADDDTFLSDPLFNMVGFISIHVALLMRLNRTIHKVIRFACMHIPVSVYTSFIYRRIL